jgi:ABC-type Zn uptake system ZnuABC Zn-binding protein ZnuA
MTPLRTLAPALTVLCFVTAFAVSCRPAPPAGASRPPRVAATIFPLYDIVRAIGGPDIRASVIVPPGASPHTFEPSPSSVSELAQTQAVFRIGHGLDEWIAAMAQSAGVASLVTVDRGISLRRFSPNEADPDHPTPGNADPHYFLTIENARRIAETVDLALSRIAPEAAARFGERRGAYQRRLDRTEMEIRGVLSGLRLHEIATFHNAFGYFAKAYGLKVVATFEPFPGLEPGPRDIALFEQRVRESGVKVIFAEPQTSLNGIRPIASDLGVRLSMLDDMGGVPGRDSYVNLLLFDARQIAEACGKGGF